MKIIFGNNISGKLVANVTPAATQLEVTQAFYGDLPLFTQGQEFLVLTLSDALNVGVNPKYETVKVTAVASGSGQYFLTVARDFDDTNGGVGGTFNASTATISMRVTAKQLNELFLKQDEDASPLTAGQRLVVSASGTITDQPIQLIETEQHVYTAGGSSFIVLTGIDMLGAQVNRHRAFITVNGVLQNTVDDYQLTWNGTNTVAQFYAPRNFIAGTKVATRVLSAL
jgi:hypothetical protein